MDCSWEELLEAKLHSPYYAITIMSITIMLITIIFVVGLM